MPGAGGMAGMGSSPVAGAGMSGPVLSGATSPLLGGDAGDVRYPYYLINGRVRTAPRYFFYDRLPLAPDGSLPRRGFPGGLSPVYVGSESPLRWMVLEMPATACAPPALASGERSSAPPGRD